MDSNLFLGPRLKVKRSQRHIAELHHVINAFLQSDFYRTGVQDDPHLGGQTFYVTAASGMPADIPLSIGDAIHNMRSALDHLATGIVRSANMRANDVYFPFDETRDGLVTRLNKGLIKASCPGIDTVIIDEIKPYRGGKTPLWELNKLDNVDKHNMIVPVIHLVEVRVDRIETEDGMILENFVATIGPGGTGGVLGGSKFKVHGNVHPRVEIRFPKGGPFENEAVLPTLTQCAEFVSEALDIIEKFLAPISGTPGADA